MILKTNGSNKCCKKNGDYMWTSPVSPTIKYEVQGPGNFQSSRALDCLRMDVNFWKIPQDVIND